ncbi:unnamed protein product [Closterium sp. NIES-54]
MAPRPHRPRLRTLDVKFDESVPFYRLFPYRSAPPLPLPLFLAPGPPPVDLLPPQGPAPSESAGAGSWGAWPRGEDPEGAEPVGVEPGSAEPEGVEPGGAESEGAESGGGATVAGGAGDAEAGDAGFTARGAGVTVGAGGTGGTAAAGSGGARTRGAGASENGGVDGAGAGDPTEPKAAGAGGTGAGGAGARGAGAAGAGAVDPRAGGAGDTPASPLPAPSPYTERSGGLTERHEPASRPVSPVRIARRVPRSRPPPVPGTHAMALPPLSLVSSPLLSPTLPLSLLLRLLSLLSCLTLLLPVVHYATALVAESESTSPPSVGGDCALGTDGLEDRQEDFECLAAAVPRFASMLLAPEGDLDAPDIPTPCSYTEAITRPYSSQCTTFLPGSLHEEIWLRRPPGFIGSFPAGTQWSLRRPVYGLRQAPREWHDTLRTTLAAIGFAPSTADPSLFLRIDTSLPPFYVLVYVDDLVFATADTEALTLVKSKLQKRHTCTDLGEVRSYLGLQITRDRALCTITRTQSHMVHQGVSGGGQIQLHRRQHEPLSPQKLREWYARKGSGGGSSGGHCAAVQLRVSGGGLEQLQRIQRETLTPQQLREWYVQRGTSRSRARCPYVICTEFGDAAELPLWLELIRQCVDVFALDYDALPSTMYALSDSAEGDYYRGVPPDPGIAATALGDSESGTLPGTTPAEALHAFTLYSGASTCFFRDSTTLTPLPAPVPVQLADPSRDPVVTRSSTVLPCPAAPFSSLSGLHLPSFSTNLVSTAALQDAMVTTTAPRGQCVSICMCTRMGRHMATFTRRPGSSLYTLATEPPHVAAYTQMSASGQVAASCSCRLLSHQTLLWHHRLGHPSLPRLRGMHSRLLVSGLPGSLPPLQTLHMDVWGPASVSGQSRDRYFLLVVDDYTRGGEFSSILLRDFCRGEGILLSFTLPDSPQQNGIAERRIGLVMEVARTSMIHAVAPHFLWPFAVWYAAHQLNLWPRVSLPETSPTLRWTGKVGDASVFRVWGSRAFVRDPSADKLSARAIPCVFLGFVPDVPGWQFYHPTSRRVLPSQDVMFDKSVPFYRLFPYRSTPLPPPPLILAPGPPPVGPLPPQGPAPSGVQVDPPLGAVPGEVAVDSGASSGTTSGGTKLGGAGPGGAEPGGVETGGAEPGSAEPEGVAPGGVALEGAKSGGAEPQGATYGAPRAGGAVVAAGASVNGGTVATGPAGARTWGTGAAGTGGVGGAGAGDPTDSGDARAGGSGAGGAGAGGDGVGGIGAGGEGAGGAGAVELGGAVRPRPYFVPLLQQVPEVLDHESDRTHAASPNVSRLLTTADTDPSFESASVTALIAELLEFAAACRLDYASALVAESAYASPPSVGGECALGTDVLEDKQEDFECLAAAVPRFTSMQLAPEGDPDAPDIPTPRSYAKAITGPYSSQWQAAMDAEMASWKSTDTYVEEVPPPGANIVDGMWIFRVKRPSGSPPAFKARYVARGFSQR